jgi:selT/selW/selH-like putative selenoprotein
MAWMAQELLSTFAEDVGEVALVPGTDGTFTIVVGDELVWDRKRDGSFPDVRTLKQRVRDRLNPAATAGIWTAPEPQAAPCSRAQPARRFPDRPTGR